MAEASNYKSPPAMRDELPYIEWKKELEIWSDFTDLGATRQGGAVFLTLTGKTRQAVLAGVTRAQMKSETAVKCITDCLDELYLQDQAQSGFAAYEEFTTYRRLPKTSIQEYLTEFNLKYNRIKNFNMELPDGVLAYYVLKCANLSEEKVNICRATCVELKYKEMRAQIEKVTSTTGSTEKEQEEVVQGQFYGYEPDFDYDNEENIWEEDEMGSEEIANDTYYASSGRPYSPRGRFSQYTTQPRQNQPDEFGKPTQCSFCHSIYHWVSRCPHAPQRPYGTRGRRASGRGSYTRSRGRFSSSQGATTRGRPANL